jgi:hypothetical protein
MTSTLTENTITFGKYKGKTLDVVLRDRGYCAWLLSSFPDFNVKYEYLFNRIQEYDPLPHFLHPLPETEGFVNRYRFFNLRSTDELTLPLTDMDRSIYTWYRAQVFKIRDAISERIASGHPEPYKIKAPTRLKQKFCSETGLEGKALDEMLKAYDLPNVISVIMADVKREAGIEYKGGNAFVIAKKRSEDQEYWWETVLKQSYGEDLCMQYVLDHCIFDFIHIRSQTIFECKLGFTEFNKEQFDKYQHTLKGYTIVYLVGNNDKAIRKDHTNDYIIDVSNGKIFLLEKNMADLQTYILNIHLLSKPSYLDNMLKDFEVIPLGNMDGPTISKALDR